MPVPEFFWDSCVLTAYLRDEQHAYDVDSIGLYLEDAQNGKVKINISSLSAAEVLPSRLKKVGSFEEFMDDYQGVVVPIDPSPNVMVLAGRLRDLPYRKGTSTDRRLSTPDAIILATALHLEDAWNVNLTAFHTFDKGGKKGAIPIIGYETWCEGFDPSQRALADRVIGLNRCTPSHPNPRLPHVP